MTAVARRTLGLRTVIYKVPDLPRAKAWYAAAFGTPPYFDEPFYVGFRIGGFELGLDPDIAQSGPGAGGATAYWGVDDIHLSLQSFIAVGAAVREPVADVGDGIRTAIVADPFGNSIGLIEQPQFARDEIR